MYINTKKRTLQSEIMDNFELKGSELKDALDKIATINQLLGGNKLTLQGVKKLLSKHDFLKPITIIDIGCGNGDMLRKLADFGAINNYNFKLIGVDANAFTINYAIELSQKYVNINYTCVNILDASFEELQYDIALCTLTLHHFNDLEIKKIVTIFNSNARIGFVINDLQRSWVAYRLFQWLCFIFRLNTMSREDGLTSILRGFKRQDLEILSKNIGLKNYQIYWKWAFRYQWILMK